jgi:hypothetical protein
VQQGGAQADDPFELLVPGVVTGLQIEVEPVLAGPRFGHEREDRQGG